LVHHIIPSTHLPCLEPAVAYTYALSIKNILRHP
jgi:hypothetical protein